jgi:hypothetical protein
MIASKIASSCFLRFTFPSLKLASAKFVVRAHRTSTCDIPLLVLAFGTIHTCTGRLDSLAPRSLPEKMSFARNFGT